MANSRRNNHKAWGWNCGFERFDVVISSKATRFSGRDIVITAARHGQRLSDPWKLRGGAQGSAAPRKMARKRRRKSEGNGHAAMHFAVSNNGPAVKATIKAWRGIAGTQTDMLPPFLSVYHTIYIYIECTSQGWVCLTIIEWKTLSKHRYRHRHHHRIAISVLSCKRKSSLVMQTSNENGKLERSWQCSHLPPWFSDPSTFPGRESVSRYPGSSLVRFPQPNRIQKAFEAERNKVNIWLIRFLAMIVQTQFLLIFNTQGLRLGIAARNKNTTQQPIINHL